MRTCRGDHPRIRGEHQTFPSSRRAASGSSPHTRGALPRLSARAQASGIIPAYAGSTTMRACSARSGADHPRIRGEHARRRAAPAAREGSSPHTRGAPMPRSVVTDVAGIIPAYAGSTPRRGFLLLLIVGSSPHTRGALHIGPPSFPGVRIIPAYAGSTGWLLGGMFRCQDHPRIRGEHSRTASRAGWTLGSSPHTRGALKLYIAHPSLFRIIPAYAGSTPQSGRTQ